MSSGQELYTLEGHPEWLRGIAFSADGRMAVEVMDDRIYQGMGCN